MSRPTWQEYFFNVVDSVAKRATCDRGKSGCVIVKNKSIIATGYVGSAPGQKHCDEVGHRMRTIIDPKTGKSSDHCVRTLHAEMNAILQAARDGISLHGADLYCKMTPCYNCAMSIIRVGIKNIYCQKRYHAGDESIKMFEEIGISIHHIDDTVEKY